MDGKLSASLKKGGHCKPNKADLTKLNCSFQINYLTILVLISVHVSATFCPCVDYMLFIVNTIDLCKWGLNE